MNKAISRLFLFTMCALLTCSKAGAQNKVAADTSQHAIPWEPIKNSDVVWTKHVWRQIDTHDDKNKVLRNDRSIPVENVYARSLLTGIISGVYNAYSNNDTGFTTPLSADSVRALIRCASNDVPLCVYPDQVTYYRIRENWIFDKGKGQMVVRITAIAPVAVINGQQQALFWVRYTDTRSYMAGYHTYNSTSTGHNWNEYFESRQFSSKIINIDGNDKIYDSLDDANKSHKRKKHRSEWVY